TMNGSDVEKFFNQLIELQVRALSGDKESVLAMIKELIPAYNQPPPVSYTGGDYSEIIKPTNRGDFSDFSAAM
ncbi:MAG: hypothetical protein U0940_00855, partial [Nitrospirota bacterium]|nr:hypothetical protein [Nitrospirota bacterium]